MIMIIIQKKGKCLIKAVYASLIQKSSCHNSNWVNTPKLHFYGTVACAFDSLHFFSLLRKKSDQCGIAREPNSSKKFFIL